MTEVKEMANAVVKSGMFPSVKTADAAFCLMMLCQSEGLHPMQALRRYNIIQGTPSMKADAVLAEFMNRGGRVLWGQMDEKACEATFEAPGLLKPTTVRWTIDGEAKRAELTGKDNWRKYPRAMLRARVISEGIRLAMPEVMVGLQTSEEAADMDAPLVALTPPREITPSAPVDTAPMPDANNPIIPIIETEKIVEPAIRQRVTMKVQSVTSSIDPSSKKIFYTVTSSTGGKIHTDDLSVAKAAHKLVGRDVVIDYKHDDDGTDWIAGAVTEAK